MVTTVKVTYFGYLKKGSPMPRRPLSVIAAIFGAGVLMIGAAGCGGSDTAAPAATVTVDQNNNDQNDQNNQNNQNNDNNQNDNQTTDETPAQQTAECLANNTGYPENCADIP